MISSLVHFLSLSISLFLGKKSAEPGFEPRTSRVIAVETGPGRSPHGRDPGYEQVRKLVRLLQGGDGLNQTRIQVRIQTNPVDRINLDDHHPDAARHRLRVFLIFSIKSFFVCLLQYS